jgi:hypothetical protein
MKVHEKRGELENNIEMTQAEKSSGEISKTVDSKGIKNMPTYRETSNFGMLSTVMSEDMSQRRSIDQFSTKDHVFPTPFSQMRNSNDFFQFPGMLPNPCCGSLNIASGVNYSSGKPTQL